MAELTWLWIFLAFAFFCVSVVEAAYILFKGEKSEPVRESERKDLSMADVEEMLR